MTHEDLHHWVRQRLAAWRASMLDVAETTRVDEHLATCSECRALAEAYAEPPAGEAGTHVPASLIANWPRTQDVLRGLERTLVRRHLERCAECRQDLEALGFEPRLGLVREWESEASLEPAASGPRVHEGAAPTAGGARVIRIETASSRARLRDRALMVWASVASAAAVLLLVANVRGRVTEGGSKPLFVPGAPVWTRDVLAQGPFSGVVAAHRGAATFALGSRQGRGRGEAQRDPGRGPAQHARARVQAAQRARHLARHRVAAGCGRRHALRGELPQWEFRPKRFLVIDRGGEPLTPGQYALVLGSQIAKAGAEIEKTARYRFELREHE
jgi:hypothetical protein